MYIIELIIKFLNKRKQNTTSKVSYYEAENVADKVPEDSCEHVFRPVDSTGMILACIKCGFVVNMNDNQNEDIL